MIFLNNLSTKRSRIILESTEQIEEGMDRLRLARASRFAGAPPRLRPESG